MEINYISTRGDKEVVKASQAIRIFDTLKSNITL